MKTLLVLTGLLGSAWSTLLEGVEARDTYKEIFRSVFLLEENGPSKITSRERLTPLSRAFLDFSVKTRSELAASEQDKSALTALQSKFHGTKLELVQYDRCMETFTAQESGLSKEAFCLMSYEFELASLVHAAAKTHPQLSLRFRALKSQLNSAIRDARSMHAGQLYMATVVTGFFCLLGFGSMVYFMALKQQAPVLDNVMSKLNI